MDMNSAPVVSSLGAEETRRPFEQASTLSGDFYHSSEILSAELDRIFARTWTMSGKSTRPPIPDLAPEDPRTVHYFHLYPGFLLSLHPDYVLTHTVWPVDTSHSRVICEWRFTPDAMGREDFDPSDGIEFWDVTNRQDWELCEIAQKGVQSRGYRPGRYQASESSVHAFDNWYLDQLEG